LLGATAAADAQVEPQLAQRYFAEAEALCERDAGRLWGVSLCGPMAPGGELQQSFVDNFEAASGPAYGVLLDELLPEWRRQIRDSSDLGDRTGYKPLEGTTLEGDGWSVTLSSGWAVRPAERPGSFTIVSEE
jgi:hypothetical protein